MTSMPVNPKRWDEEWAANLDVLNRMKLNGDRPDVVREVDVSFRGPIENLKKLAENCAEFGFRVQNLEIDGLDEPWLFIVRDQTADEDAIRALTSTYLQIEDAFHVECDGWGCIAQAN
ncbi:MAG: ribonuclease E inhibitor RraB [Sphingomonadales bacterium]|nr:ribonuclease E inhibitor RraB [Sphingomonadales bacterium]